MSHHLFESNQLAGLLCKVIGHKWQPVIAGTTKRSVLQICLRCRENGWELLS